MGVGRILGRTMRQAIGRVWAAMGGVVVLTGLAIGPASGQGHDSLTIGIHQFPTTLHPSIDSMMAKSYILGFVRRPITVYDADWQGICLLCTELPSAENGRITTATGDDGVDRT